MTAQEAKKLSDEYDRRIMDLEQAIKTFDDLIYRAAMNGENIAFCIIRGLNVHDSMLLTKHFRDKGFEVAYSDDYETTTISWK